MRSRWILWALASWLVVAVPCLLAPGPCEETFNTVEDDDDDDDDDNDDAGDDDGGDDDDDAGDDDDTADDDDDAGDDDDTSGGWLIGHAWVECQDYGKVSEWSFWAQMTGPCDIATVELEDTAGYYEAHNLSEGANFLFSAHPSSDYDTAFTCDMAFDIHWYATDLPNQDDAWSSWP